MKRETVVFDLGGVVFNWEPLRLMREVFPHRVSDDTDAAQLLANVFQSHSTDGDWAQWDLGLTTPPVLAKRIAQRLKMEPHEIMALIESLAPHMHVKQDTVALIQDLKAAGHRLVYLSNMPEELAQWIEQDHPFSDWFEDGVFSARAGLVKPAQAIYRFAENQWNLHETSPVFVDDMPPNVAVAQGLGWRSLQFKTADLLRRELQNWQLLK